MAGLFLMVPAEAKQWLPRSAGLTRSNSAWQGRLRIHGNSSTLGRCCGSQSRAPRTASRAVVGTVARWPCRRQGGGGIIRAPKAWPRVRCPLRGQTWSQRDHVHHGGAQQRSNCGAVGNGGALADISGLQRPRTAALRMVAARPWPPSKDSFRCTRLQKRLQNDLGKLDR